MLPPSLSSSSDRRRAMPAMTLLAHGDCSRTWRASCSLQLAIGLSFQTSSAAITEAAEQRINQRLYIYDYFLRRHLKLVTGRTLGQNVARMAGIWLQLLPQL